MKIIYASMDSDKFGISIGKNDHEIHYRVISIHSKKAHLIVIDADFFNFKTNNQQFNELGGQLFVNLLEEIPHIKKL